MAMRYAWAIAFLAFRCFGYELTGHIEPPAPVHIFLHGATAPFEISAESGADGRFRLRKLPAGTYTLVVSTATRGEALQTVELSAGTVDSKGRLDIALRIDDSRLESDGARTPGATVSAAILSIPDHAMKEYQEAQKCLRRNESDRASAHLRRVVEIAPRFVSAWNQLGTIAYQTHRYSEAETNFRRGLDIDPAAFEPLVNLGGVLLNLGRPREAVTYNQRAVARRPNDALANSQLGLSYFGLNDLDPAEKYLKIAVQFDPAHFSHPQLPLAEIYLRRGDRPSALRVLRDFVERHPDSPQAAGVRQKVAELVRQEAE
jgi:tetratricopeptide (TPR) repeat protein